MLKFIRESPVILFLFLATFITQTSILFPQQMGNQTIVAGWPLTMYTVELRRQTEIEDGGQITHKLVKHKTKMDWVRVFTNIGIWLLLMQGTWWAYHELSMQKQKKNSQ